MKLGIKKSIQEEVDLMIELYKNGLSCCEIGRRLKRDHTTVMYWIKKSKIGKAVTVSKIEYKGLNDHKIAGIRKMIDYKKSEKKPDLVKVISDICLECKKQKSEGWKKTDVCSVKCWDLNYQKVNHHQKQVVYY